MYVHIHIPANNDTHYFMLYLYKYYAQTSTVLQTEEMHCDASTINNNVDTLHLRMPVFAHYLISTRPT